MNAKSGLFSKATRVVNVSQLLWGGSYYGVYALLLVFFTTYLNFSEEKSIAMMGLYGALGPIASSIGGRVADRLLGARRGIIVGYLLYTLGFALLSAAAAMGTAGADFDINKNAILVATIALALMSLARGVASTNNQVLISKSQITEGKGQYNEQAFSINYMNNNIGSFVGQFAFPLMQAKLFGTSVTFLVGAIIIGVNTLFLIAQYKALESGGSDPDKHPLPIKTAVTLLIAAVLVGVILFFGFSNPAIGRASINYLTAIIVLYLLYLIVQSNKEDRIRILVCIILLFEILIFFVYYNQMFSSILFFAVKIMRPVSWLDPQATMGFNPLGVTLLSPVLALALTKLDAKGKNPHIGIKFAIGIGFSALAFLLLGWRASAALEAYRNSGGDGYVSVWWLLLGHTLQSGSELLIASLGAAALSKIAPARMTGFILAIRLVTMASASMLAASLAQKIAMSKDALQQDVLARYSDFFSSLGMWAVYSMGLMIVVYFLLKKIYPEKI